MFMFLRPEICRQLPLDSNSEWTSLLRANGWQLIASIGLEPSNILAMPGAPTKKARRNKSTGFYKSNY